MRLSLSILLRIYILLLLSGCGFELFEAEIDLSEIEILAISQDNTSTLVTVEVGAGSSAPELVGLSYSEEENFSVIDNQNLYGVNEPGVYELALDGLTPEVTYYLKAFVGEDVAYAQSQTVSFLVPRPTPPVIPCTVVPDQIRDRGATFNNPSVGSNDGAGLGSQYGLRIDCGIGGPSLTVSFVLVPNSGVYQTSTFGGLDTNNRNVFINYQSGFLQGSAETGQSVYVEKLGEEHYLISFCDIEYTLSASSTVYTFTGQVEVGG